MMLRFLTARSSSFCSLGYCSGRGDCGLRGPVLVKARLREEEPTLEHGHRLVHMPLVEVHDRVRLQAVQLRAPVIRGSEHTSRGVNVVLCRLTLALVLTEQGEPEEGARLPVARPVVLRAARVLQRELHLLARALRGLRSIV